MLPLPGLALIALLAPGDPLADEYVRTVRPLLAKYCRGCHAGDKAEADLDFDKFATRADVRRAAAVWQRAGELLDAGQMPPRDARQPTGAERDALRGWVRRHLTAEARAHAGDPGRVPLRRLSHAEYTYTVRDLTGVGSRDPAKEFPADGAAGEGFTNAADALAMSPPLLAKYLDAAKRVAAHAVLLPDGVRFSPHAARPDWANETLGEIRGLYHRYSDAGGGSKVALQGLVWDGKEGGRLPVERYVAATLIERDALRAGRTTIAAAAAARGLSAKYLETVWAAFTGPDPLPPLDAIRDRWRTAKPEDAAAVAAEITRWQAALWRFHRVGHVGKAGGPTAWMEPAEPLVTRVPVRYAVPAGDAPVTARLSATGADGTHVVWQSPRFVAPGRPDLLLRDARAVAATRTAKRAEALAATTTYLRAADEAAAANGTATAAALAQKHDLDADVLRGWLDLLGVGTDGPVRVGGHLTNKLSGVGGHAFVAGWGSTDTPSLVANASDTPVRIPGNLKARGIAVHPSPALAVAVGWQSPAAGPARVAAKVAHAHPECGNGVTWAVELRRGATRRRLASGTAQGAKPATIAPIENVTVAAGDLVSIVVGPRDGNHACDLTAIDLAVTVGGKTWDLAKDVTGDVHAGNPHGVWHFYAEPVDVARPAALVPPGSALDRWRTAAGDRAKLAADVQRVLVTPPADPASPDAALHRQLTALGGPLFGRVPAAGGKTSDVGVDPARFGTHQTGPADLCIRVPSAVEVALPADLIAGYELVSTAVLHPDSAARGLAQVEVTAGPAASQSLRAGPPILVADRGPARDRIATGLAAVRDLFPPAVCYAKVVPVDEVVTLTLYHREDHHLARLMLTDAERARLDRLWDELRYVSRDAFAQVDALNQLLEYATQDSDPRPFLPLKQPFADRAAALRRRLVETEPRHLDAVVRFAEQAYRRPLTPAEAGDLAALYRRLRGELPHDDAIRLVLARVLVAPAFLYKLETPGPAAAAVPVSDWELASRLSYFLWSSAPDADLRAAAAAGELHKPDALAAQARRMLTDARVRRLATEFGCQWLHVRGFAGSNEKSERHFPTFAGLRAAIDEEAVLVFTDLFRADRPLASLLDADATFLNGPLAAHYGIPGVAGDHWRRVEGVRRHGRGGVLALAAPLAAHAGASRTSPTLRGNWVSEVLLGEKLPRPPKGVPQLPDDEAATAGRTVRELVARHSADPNCATCHRRIDPYGFALEGYDAIGRRRDADLAGRPIDATATAADGAALAGLDGLRDYLLTTRRDAFERQFCRKLLGFALGRGVRLSDEPLLDDMRAALAAAGGRVSAAVETIVRSRQFREIRGRQHPADE